MNTILCVNLLKSAGAHKNEDDKKNSQNEPSKGQLCVDEIHNPVDKSAVEGSGQTVPSFFCFLKTRLAVDCGASGDDTIICKSPCELFHVHL